MEESISNGSFGKQLKWTGELHHVKGRVRGNKSQKNTEEIEEDEERVDGCLWGDGENGLHQCVNH